jgi:hypothetical protein
VSALTEFGSGADLVVKGWSVGEENSSAEEIEAGAAVHLAFDGFNSVDVAFDWSGAVGQGESGGDGGQVAA